MSAIQFGCQTYTWQMSYDKYSDAMDHIMEVVATSRFAGVEAEVCMLGKYRTEPAKLADALRQRNLTLAAICLVCNWSDPMESEAERAEADRVIAFLEQFPGTMLALCQMPGKDRSRLESRQKNCIDCCNTLARRSADAGVPCAFHPNSPPASLFRTEEDYKVLLGGLDSGVLGFAPDAGHIAAGGMDVVRIFRQYAPMIKHVHFKDRAAAGGWALMGKGGIDFPTVTADLKRAGYHGWIMVEDESPLAEVDPDAATRTNGAYVRSNLAPL
jgi:inosose dehydratase